MSGINGDKSRFHRVRKQKIARRMRNRAMLKSLAEQSKAVSTSTGVGPKPVAA